MAVRRASLLLASVLIVGVTAPASATPVLGHAAAACHRFSSLEDAEAQERARTAQTTAEVIAVDHNGSYALLSPREAHKVEPSIPITRGQAIRQHERAYLAAAYGTLDSFTVVTRALNGDSYRIERARNGSIYRHATVCGKHREW